MALAFESSNGQLDVNGWFKPRGTGTGLRGLGDVAQTGGTSAVAAEQGIMTLIGGLLGTVKSAGSSFTTAAGSIAKDNSLQSVLSADAAEESTKRFAVIAGVAVAGLAIVGIGYELMKKSKKA